MAVNLAFIGGAGWQFLDDNGDPLSGGKVYTYAAGTTTPQTTYTSRSGLIPNTNPIILDAAGRTPEQIWATEGLLYKYVVADANNVLIRTWDNIGGSVVSSNLAQDLANTTDDAKGDALIGFRQSGQNGFLNGAVARTVNNKFQEFLSVKDFGAKGDNATDDTAAIQACIDAAVATGQTYGRFNLKPAPLENAAIGTRPVVFFPAGTYRISNRLNFGFTMIFRGENSIIYQTDATKDIFYTEGPFFNQFDNLSFVGGNRQIFAQNGATGLGGIEGAQVIITNCEFQAHEGYAVQTQRSGGAGGFFTGIERSRFIGGKQCVYIDQDQAYVSDCWIGTYGDEIAHPADTALFVFKTNAVFKNNALIPGLTYSDPTDTRRYIDSYNELLVHNNRFGAEGGGGIPIVYSFHDQSLSDIYPYQGPGVSITDNIIVADGSASRLDKGYVVLKRGLPQRITIENNSYAFDGPYIRTNKMSGSYPDLATYMSTAFTASVGKQNAKRFSFSIKNNSRWAGAITQSASDTALLAPYMEYDNGTSTSKISTYNDLVSNSITLSQIIAANFVATSTSTGVSIVDTGITRTSAYWGFGLNDNSAIYDVYVTGNPNLGGSAQYRSPLVGCLIVGVAFVGSQVFEIQYSDIYKPNMTGNTEFTVSAVFWDGVSETSTASLTTTAQIRIKVSGYASSYEGAAQQVRLVRRL